MDSVLTCVIHSGGYHQNVDFSCCQSSPLCTRNRMYELSGRRMTRTEVYEFMMEQFRGGGTNNGVLLGFVLLKMDDDFEDGALAHFHVS